MSFSPSTREDVLVRSARRCCVCREFKGVGLEVHHIVPQASGGSDDIENAIALCFDCHASAGHYNLKHPKGTKFSPQELVRHRDQLWGAVSAGLVFGPPSGLASKVHVAHVVCIDYEEASAILAGDCSNGPFRPMPVLQSPVTERMARVLDALAMPCYGSQTRTGLGPFGRVISYGSNDHAEFLAANPTFLGVDERPICLADLGNGEIAESAFLLQCLSEGVITEADIGTAAIHHDACGEGAWLVEYKIRKPLFVFCTIRNISGDFVTVNSVAGIQQRHGNAPTSTEGPVTVSLAPSLLLPPGESAFLLAFCCPQQATMTWHLSGPRLHITENRAEWLGTLTRKPASTTLSIDK